MSDKPRDGEVRAVNYIIGVTDDGGPIINHRLEQYYSGKWKPIRVYHEDAELTGGNDGRSGFDEYGHYGENNPPVGSGK
jgi:hypothetical protein